MADDDAVQITTPILQTLLVPARAPRAVSRARALADVSRVARAAHAAIKPKPVEPEHASHAPGPPIEAHERLTPATAAILSEIHAVEGELMVRAMIEAAKADGEIDPEERRRILTCLRDADAPESDRQALLAALDQPPDVDALVARVSSPELAVEVYAASLLAIGGDKPVEQRYLARLAERLKLPAETVAALHARFGDPPPLDSPPL